MRSIREGQYRALELPEIISGMLVLFVVLWEACFEPMATGRIERDVFVKGTHLALCGLVWFNTAAVFLHFLTQLVHKRWPGRFLWWQLIVGGVASFVFSGGVWSFLPTQAYWVSLLLSLVLGAFSFVNILAYRRARRRSPVRGQGAWSPAVVFFTSMVALVVVSALILMTPGAARIPISYTDALFTCASAISITGLTCIDVSQALAPLGKLVLLFDIQVGAMGVMSFSYFVLLMVGKKLNVRDSSTMSTLLDQVGVNIIPSLLKAVFFVTILLELLGAVALYFLWLGHPGVPQGNLWFFALFHSVSAFCNAGITLFPDNMAQECVAHSYAVQSVMMLLILAGTLGFGVYLEGITRLRQLFSKKRTAHRWSTHTWLVIRVTFLVLLIGSIGLALLGAFEPSTHARSADYNLWEGAWNAIGRSAGFNITDIGDYGPVYHIFLCVLMFIGGNPTGTGGGVYAPVFALCVLEVLRVLRGQQDVELHSRRIARNTVERAMATVVLSTCWIVLTTMLLLLLEPTLADSENGIVKILFLEVSAYTTTGFSLCDPAELSDWSKMLVVLNMLFGRVGMFTFMLIFISQRDPSPIRYPETRLPLN